MYADSYITKSETIGVGGGDHPQCSLCRHVTERAFSASDETHNVKTHKAHDTIYVCVACWSEYKKDEDDA